jgi:uncharacterized membrane protein (DUF4010 family)
MRTVAVVGTGARVAYQRTGDRNLGMTTEVALPLTCVVGGLAIQDALMAAGVGTVLALLLASRNRMHYFVQKVLSAQELHDIIFFSVALVYRLIYLARASKGDDHSAFDKRGRAFDLKTSVGFAVLLSVVLVVSAGLNSLFGSADMVVGAAVSGFADAHATAASAASLLAAGKIEEGQAIVPILVGLTTNTTTKAIVAFNSGVKAYALQVVPGLVAMLVAVWLGAWLTL